MAYLGIGAEEIIGGFRDWEWDKSGSCVGLKREEERRNLIAGFG
jgi:hypothetical protein